MTSDSPTEFEEHIARRAYALWEQRGRPLGSPQVDWYEAVRETRDALSSPDPATLPFSEFRMGPVETRAQDDFTG